MDDPVLDPTLTGDGARAGDATRPGTLRVLTLVHGPDPARLGEQVVLERSAVALDRASPAFPGGPLGDRQLSRAHARVEPASGRGGDAARPAAAWRVVDLGSKNGTFVNGQPVPPGGTDLDPGDVIRVGETLVLCQEVAVPPPADAPAAALASLAPLVGRGPAVRTLRAAIARLAPRDAPVLVLGETGSGKELVARALHDLGRPERRFTAVNVSALPATVADAMLFGHVRGAFTDAREAAPGLFRDCDGGTLFLDEIGDLAPEVQAKLLRAVEEGTVLPVGATRPVAVDVRIVAATHRDLPGLAARGAFRGDLYARLSPLQIRVPPLRDRVEDVPLLALRFAEGRAFAAADMQRLVAHPWPYNVRELRAVVEQARAEAADAKSPLRLTPAILARLDEARRTFEAAATAGGGNRDDDLAKAAAPVDRATLEAALVRAGGNVARAAAILGKDRANLYRLARRLGVDPDRFR